MKITPINVGLANTLNGSTEKASSDVNTLAASVSTDAAVEGYMLSPLSDLNSPSTGKLSILIANSNVSVFTQALPTDAMQPNLHTDTGDPASTLQPISMLTQTPVENEATFSVPTPTILVQIN